MNRITIPWAVGDYLEDKGKTATQVLEDPVQLRALLSHFMRAGYAFPEKNVRVQLEHLTDTEKAAATQALLEPQGSSPGPFIQAVAKEPHRLAQAVLDHFIWQVKRKMAKLQVKWHIMPVLVGTQNGGKSQLIERLLSPLPEWAVAGSSLHELNDERARPGLASNYVLTFDEMAGARKADISALKCFITAKKVFYRPMQSNTRHSVLQSATLIGASNHFLSELIADETGMRRFFQIECLDVLNWEFINGYDWISYFKSVNHIQPSPIEPFLEQLGVAQAGLVRSSIEEWLEAFLPEESHMATQLHEKYKRFALDNGFKDILSSRPFAAALRNAGWKDEHVRLGTSWIPPERNPKEKDVESVVAGADKNASQPVAAVSAENGRQKTNLQHHMPHLSTTELGRPEALKSCVVDVIDNNNNDLIYPYIYGEPALASSATGTLTTHFQPDNTLTDKELEEFPSTLTNTTIRANGVPEVPEAKAPTITPIIRANGTPAYKSWGNYPGDFQ
ncbi:MAG TPA: VapE domain-containing protein [Patescibacteria group bacterium]|nr:VapE domain-containing protein [Patescibacteria group bacterium]